ncbi:TPA: hypothetical protein RJN57_000499 [Pseudomonas aeruginosa]|uniref:hypothetical protein n=1 Tax=Pseudomonas aeruginosa TaxID=287 RepID=UPI00104BAA9E|nr:hypothetical protein [Pseudomonas aeruginosa]HDV6122995.1 hypothetical protein [Pseudomonas aeruginosa]HDV6143873.1 hypothetical protein [Pseudomonas aeruginosa]HDV6168479.1 hypothetical protein [Pseudomonas aeruginosa]
MISVDIKAVLSSPGTSYWLKDALASALQRDIVDAANDAQALSSLLEHRCAEACGVTRLVCSFRAESAEDAMQFLQACRSIDTTMAATFQLDGVGTDVEVEVTTSASISSLQSCLAHRAGAEVIRQTLRALPLAMNTLERDPAL